MIEPNHSRISVVRQCELLGLSRSSYYREPAPETEETLQVMRRIDEIYTQYPFSGAGRFGILCKERELQSTGSGYSV